MNEIEKNEKDWKNGIRLKKLNKIEKIKQIE